MNGKVVRSFRNYLDANGNVIREESLGKSYYQPMARIIARPSELAEGETEETGETVVEQHETEPVREETGGIPSESGTNEEYTPPVESVPVTEPDASEENFDPNIDPFGDVMP